jgi:hypothetical protein
MRGIITRPFKCLNLLPYFGSESYWCDTRFGGFPVIFAFGLVAKFRHLIGRVILLFNVNMNKWGGEQAKPTGFNCDRLPVLHPRMMQL